MITKLILTNFKKHQSLTLNLSKGLIGLKGANEAGKSTIFHAIAYALFGARALPMPLSETVTYDRPESSLKVVLELDYAGKDYKIQRSKSGAILTCGELAVNGQAEVTRYVENLLSVNADTAGKMMIASQKGLSGALEGNAAIPLIEKLANIDMIDGLITKIQDQLPCGNTKVFISRIEELSEVPIPSTDYKSLEPEVVKASEIIESIKFNILNAKTNLGKTDVNHAKQVIESASKQTSNIARLNAELDIVEEQLAIPVLEFEGDIEALRAKYAEQLTFREREAAYRKFLGSLGKQEYYEDSPSLNQHIAETRKAIEELSAKINDYRIQLVKLQGLRIDDESCALCGKLLQDVPEVVIKNRELTEQTEGICSLKSIAEAELIQLNVKLGKLQSYKEANIELEKVYAAISKYVSVEYTTPIKLHWTAPIPEQADLTDYVSAIKQAEKEKDAAIKSATTHENYKLRKTKILEELAKNDVVYSVEEAQELLDISIRLNQQIQDYSNKLHHAEMLLQQAEHKLKVAKLQYDYEEENYNQAQEAIADAQKTMLLYEKHNSLIKKLREARPVIAARLWSIVLATVSTYFSQIRGVPSVVTRGADNFLVDGKAVGGVSGSTFDSLGLAMRMALGKTFLPMVDFILLDEPASGMDDERETAMLGLLSVTNYRQVLLVTHSSLADSFVGSMVQL